MLRHDTTLGRLARAPFRLLPHHAVMPVLSGPLRGAKWVIGSSQRGCWIGSYERQTQRVMQALVVPGMTVLDAGANVGFFTLLAARLVGPAGRVIAFEPFSENAQRLRQHVKLNPAPIAVEEAALGQTSGVGTLHVGVPESASLFPLDTGLPVFQVTLVALDDWRAQDRLPTLDFVKMDIEGAEGAAIFGMQQVLTTDRPILCIALHGGPQQAEMIESLRTLHYLIATPYAINPQYAADVLAVPAERHRPLPDPFVYHHDLTAMTV